MKGYRILVIALLLTTAAVQSTFAQKEKYQSIFIYNFSKYVKWPEGSVSGKFVIGVFGSSGIKQELDEMATTKNVGGTPIQVLQFSTTAGIEECHILYLVSSESGRIAQIIEAVKGKPVLVVTDKPGMWGKGAAINFVELDGKIKFEINQQVTEAHGLKVSSSLTNLAIIVKN
jgi:hypothetical protein